MLPPSSDGNVLYGLMALQLGVISRSELAAALAEWASDRSLGLDAILIGRGRIAPRAHAMLEELVSGAPALGGAAPAGQGGATEAGVNGRSPSAVEETIGALATIGDGGPLPTSSVPLAIGGATRPGPRFRILRPHNEGGLGVISVARDEELGRQVALKEIKLRYADDRDSRARFLLEAEITGKLEHPGIVPVYGLGTFADGRPYYAMRLVRGENLAEAIDRLHKAGKSGFDPVRRSLTSRQVLERFLDVCDTIEYAHSRGVIHRDLKPDNVMLGPYGETLVVDWGLARPMGTALSPSNSSGEAPVRTSELDLPVEIEGSPTGTPRYMSPEQVRGELDRLGAATDVYGLGATLYHLLTGEPPLRGVHGAEIYRRVDQGTIPHPRAVNRRVPRALDAICRKAMALRPEDRYPSARSLAEDLRRWLADEPVSAWKGSPIARLGRWGRRNRASVLAGFIALIVVSVASVMAAFASGRAASREHRASEEATAARRRAERSETLAIAAQARAELAHERVVRGTARFASETIRRELTSIGRVLRAQAEAPRAGPLLARAASDPADESARDDLQQWLESAQAMHEGIILASNWFLTGPDGTQLARVPLGGTIGQNFAYRDYFHGMGRDLSPRDVEELRAEGRLHPVEALHQSPVFRSLATGNPMTTFSVPVPAPEPPGGPAGVLGISVEIGDFEILGNEDGRGMVLSLVETRPDAEGRPGLMLQHPALAAMGDDPRRVYLDDPELLARLDRLRAESLRAERDGGDKRPADPELAVDRDYRDPFGPPYDGPWLAAFQPVLAEGPEGVRDTGWVVIVQGRRLAEGPAAPRP